MRKLLLFLIVAVLIAVPVGAKKVQIRLKDPANTATALQKKEESKGSIDICRDSTYIARHMQEISISGYDKSVNSSTESFFLTNSGKETLKGVEMEITYKTTDGRMIHKAVYKSDCDVPPGETRRLEVKTFDTQKSFYYYKSNPPRKRAMPFEVEFKVTGLLF